MKRSIILKGILLSTMFLCSCAAPEAQATASAAPATFKEIYESLNGTFNTDGKENRTVSIPDDAPFVETAPEDVLARAEAKETFYVVYSDALCPWCRSVVEAACRSAAANHIDQIYAVDIWDEQGEEVFRDKYEVADGKLTKVLDGTEAYSQTLAKFGSVLSDYTLKDANGTRYSVGEKRIFAPNFIYVKEGTPVALTEGISSLQDDPRAELSDAVSRDQEAIFNQFFSNK